MAKRIPWNKGKKETRINVLKKLSESHKGQKPVNIDYLNKIQKGLKHPNWKGGREITKTGYIMLWSPEHPKAHKGKVYEHRLIMEKKLGRYLEKKETIHHINGNKQDNRIENLKLYNSHSQHMKKSHSKKIKYFGKNQCFVQENKNG